MVDHLVRSELFRKEQAKPCAFPLMTLESRETLQERARIAMQAIPFALPKKQEPVGER